jgi:VanZ family protein
MKWLGVLGPVALYAAVIFALSTIPGNRVPPIGVPGFDKVEHAILYGLLGLLLARAIRALQPTLDPILCVIAVGYLAGFYGVTDEIHQLFTPGRSCDPFDALADLVGGTLGAVAWVTWRHLRSRPDRQRPTREAAPS